MLRNYFKSAIRHLIRHKTFTFINLLGLTVGLSTSLFILLWIQDEVTYDRFNRDIDRIYEIFENQTYSDNKIYTFSATPSPLAASLQAEYPEIELAARVDWGGRSLFRYEDNTFYAEGNFADSTMLQIFTFNWLEGNPDNPLPDHSCIVINSSLAQKLFGDEKALNKVIKFRNQEDLRVSGVYEDLPSNSSFKFEYIAPFYIYERDNPWLDSWGNNSLRTYLKLNKNADYHDLDKKIIDYVKTKNEGSYVTLFLHSYKDLHLYSNFEKGKLKGGRISYVKAFGYVAIFILIIACINFMNLTTARSAIRSREVGIRKVVGANRSSLVNQFMGESFLITFIALVISVLLVILLLPVFNNITDKKVLLDFTNYQFWIGFLIILIVTGTLSGSYPAFFLAAFKPVSIIKNQGSGKLKGTRLRKVLVVIQFSLSVILIVSALIIYKQLKYLQNKNLGFDKENVLYFYNTMGINENFEGFRNDALSQPFISAIGKGNHLPYQVGSSSWGIIWDGKQEDTDVLFQTFQTDYDMIEMLGFDLIDGRYFSRDHATDSSNYIINEAAARSMGMDNPVGQNLECWGKKGQIIGVVKDFHSRSLYSPIEPLIFILNPDNTWITFIRIEPGQTKKAISYLEGLYKQYDPDFPFEYHFLDKSYEELYNTVTTIGKLADYFTGIAIFIACLGLFGLASFTVEQRSKEISIRKVFGASVSRLVTLLTMDFTWLILMAILLGSPIAWYFMNKFLSGYAYHTNIGIYVFFITACTILILALITIAYQSIRASLANPAESLRNE